MTGVEYIGQERARQSLHHGFTAHHDNRHSRDQLATAAACYALPRYHRDHTLKRDWAMTFHDYLWPFDEDDWKPTPDDRIRELTKAGALIAAEIDRLLRLDTA